MGIKMGLKKQTHTIRNSGWAKALVKGFWFALGVYKYSERRLYKGGWPVMDWQVGGKGPAEKRG